MLALFHEKIEPVLARVQHRFEKAFETAALDESASSISDRSEDLETEGILHGFNPLLVSMV